METLIKSIVISLLFCLNFSLVYAADIEAMKATGKGEDSDFSNSTLVGTNLLDIKMDGSKFISSKLTDVSINECGECNFSSARLIRINFEKASIDEIILDNAQIADTIFIKSYAHNPRIRNAVISNTKMDRANMSKGIFDKTSIKDTSMVGVQLKSASFSETVFINVDLSYADLSYADFTGAKLFGTKFKNSVLYGANFMEADLTGADFRGANIIEAYFKLKQGFDISTKIWDTVPGSISCDELKARGAIIDVTTKCN